MIPRKLTLVRILIKLPGICYCGKKYDKTDLNNWGNVLIVLRASKRKKHAKRLKY